ncbi:MAG: carboxypeptidase-like regulatory domain-containing protein [Acidobacteriaceae bacterium]|nr:carboxypeptidase-like regulatory domain-containing protein [Acidobacteriaceae bacterium]
MKFHLKSGRCTRPALYALAAVAITAGSATAHAQFRTSIQGTVTDPSGAVIPNAKLDLKDNQTNQVRSIVSDASGVFTFQALPADHFTLTITSTGFKKKVYSDLTFIPEQANSLQVQLDLGAADTTINVDASTVPVIDTQTSNIGATISANQIQHMPVFNNDVFTLSQLAPGVVADGAQSAGGGVFTNPGNQGPGGSTSSGARPTENGVQANANGQNYSNNGISLDGISTVSAVWGGTTIITPNPDSVDNVRVVTNNYDAEDGRFAGAQTLVTSKSGTNQLHGSAFLSIHRPGLNAYNKQTIASQTPQRNNARFNYYGGTLGGPIWKDKVFAFFSFESSPQTSNTTGLAWYETPAFRALAQTGSIASTYLGQTGGVPNGTLVANQPTCADAGRSTANCAVIAGQGLDIGSRLTGALGTQDLTTDGTNQNPGVGGGLDGVADIAYYNTVNPTSSYYRQFNGRLDANVTNKDHLAFTIYWVPQGDSTYTGGTRDYNYFVHNQVSQAMSTIWDHTFTPTFVNEARANVSGWRWNEFTSNPQQLVGLAPAAFDVNFGTASTSTMSQFGTSIGSHLDQWTIAYKDVATKTLGSHTIKFGAEYTGLHYLLDPTAQPTYDFYNVWDFLNDAPYKESGNFNYQTGKPGGVRQDERENLWGGFIQDDWKIKPNMTLHAGLRYSYFGALYSKQNALPSITLGSGASAFTNMRAVQGHNLWNPDKYNFGPQLGFNWSPEMFNNKMVVRAGYGLSFNQSEIAITANTGYNPPVQNSITFQFNSPSNSGTNGSQILYAVSSDLNSTNGFPANPNAVTSYNTNSLPTAGNASMTILGDGNGKYPTIYVQHYSADVEYQFPFQIVASLGYQGSVSRHLITQQTPNAYAVVRGYTLNPLVPNGGGSVYLNAGSANNNSMLVEVKHPFAHHFTIDGQFQWAKSLDVNGSGPYSEDAYYPANAGSSYGPSDFNVGKMGKVYGLWQPVFFHGDKRWIEKIAGGWSLSGIFNWHTGYPFSPSYGISQSLYCNSCGYTSLRPYYNGRGGNDHSNNAFIHGTNFQNTGTATTQTATVNGNANTVVAYNDNYFNIANFTNSITWQNAAGGVTPTQALPNPAGMRRNGFVGPSYRDVDMSLVKAFGVPNTRLLGDNAKLELRADALNLFNLLNLNPSSVTTAIGSGFGSDVVALSGRQITFQARFSF